MPYEQRDGRGCRLGARARPRPAADDTLSPRARARRRPEHVLPSGLRALRRRALGHGRRRRQRPPVRVPLPQPRRDHADHPDARHAPGDADLSRALARRRARRATRRRTRSSRSSDVEHGRWRFNPGAGRTLGIDPGAGQRYLLALRPAARGGRQVRAHDLAVPRDARRDRPRARPGRRRGGVLPHDRAAEPAGFPGQGLEPADRALLRDRPRGDGRCRTAR